MRGTIIWFVCALGRSICNVAGQEGLGVINDAAAAAAGVSNRQTGRRNKSALDETRTTFHNGEMGEIGSIMSHECRAPQLYKVGPQDLTPEREIK